MTIEEAVQQAAVFLDAMLKEHWHELGLRMIADGVDPNAQPDPEPVTDGGWRRTTFNEVMARQIDRDLVWRAEMLDQVRAGVEEIAALAKAARE